MMSASNDGTIRLWGFQLLEGYWIVGSEESDFPGLECLNIDSD